MVPASFFLYIGALSHDRMLLLPTKEVKFVPLSSLPWAWSDGGLLLLEGDIVVLLFLSLKSDASG